MEEKEKFDQIKYQNEYRKKNYKKKSLYFKNEELQIIEKVLKKQKTTLKPYIMKKIQEDYNK